MSGGIFLIQANGELVEMTEQAYDSETLLQQLLAKYPGLLAGGQVDAAEPRRWLFVAREQGVPDREGGPDRWSIDHVFLDQDGVPTIIEVKRSSDTRIRREVVGQMLDYAANAAVNWPVETIRLSFEVGRSVEGRDPEAVLADFLGAEADPEEFWQAVKTNLQAGRVRMVFVADAIPTELQRIVEFLNSQMDPAEVLAVEIKQFVGQDLRGLVPRVLGRTAEAQARKGASGPRSVTSEDELLPLLQQKYGDQAEKASRHLLRLAEEIGGLKWGASAFMAKARIQGRLVTIYSVDILGRLWVSFPNFISLAPEQALADFVSDLAVIPAFANIAPDSTHHAIYKLAEVFSSDQDAESFAHAVRRFVTSASGE